MCQFRDKIGVSHLDKVGVPPEDGSFSKCKVGASHFDEVGIAREDERSILEVEVREVQRVVQEAVHHLDGSSPAFQGLKLRVHAGLGNNAAGGQATCQVTCPPTCPLA